MKRLDVQAVGDSDFWRSLKNRNGEPEIGELYKWSFVFSSVFSCMASKIAKSAKICNMGTKNKKKISWIQIFFQKKISYKIFVDQKVLKTVIKQIKLLHFISIFSLLQNFAKFVTKQAKNLYKMNIKSFFYNCVLELNFATIPGSNTQSF